MTPTPLTDAAYNVYSQWDLRPTLTGDASGCPPDGWELACDLEKKLAALTSCAEKMAETLKAAKSDVDDFVAIPVCLVRTLDNRTEHDPDCRRCKMEAASQQMREALAAWTALKETE